MRCLGYYLGLTFTLFALRPINTVLLLRSLSVTIVYVQNAVLDELWTVHGCSVLCHFVPVQYIHLDAKVSLWRVWCSSPFFWRVCEEVSNCSVSARVLKWVNFCCMDECSWGLERSRFRCNYTVCSKGLERNQNDWGLEMSQFHWMLCVW